jgi:hypothetical protein
MASGENPSVVSTGQPHCIHIHYIGPRIRRHLPHLAQQLAPAAALPAPQQQKLEQRKLLDRQLHEPAVPHHTALHAIQLNIAVPQHRIGKLIPPPQQRTAACRQFMKAEGLQQAVVRPKVQTLHPLLYLTPPGQHQHGGLIEPPPHLRQHFSPILLRKAQIEHNQVRAMLRSMFQRRLPIAHPGHFVALQLQPLLQKQPQGNVVFHNQNSHFSISQNRKVFQHRKSQY